MHEALTGTVPRRAFFVVARLLKKSICFVVSVTRNCGVRAEYASFLTPRRLAYGAFWAAWRE